MRIRLFTTKVHRFVITSVTSMFKYFLTLNQNSSSSAMSIFSSSSQDFIDFSRYSSTIDLISFCPLTLQPRILSHLLILSSLSRISSIKHSSENESECTKTEKSSNSLCSTNSKHGVHPCFSGDFEIASLEVLA